MLVTFDEHQYIFPGKVMPLYQRDDVSYLILHLWYFIHLIGEIYEHLYIMPSGTGAVNDLIFNYMLHTHIYFVEPKKKIR